MNTIIKWLINTLLILVVAYVIPGITVPDPFTAFVIAIFLSLVNSFLRPLIIILTLPINILTLGLFTLVINAGLVMLTALVVPGFVVATFWAALLFSLLLSLINALLNKE